MLKKRVEEQKARAMARFLSKSDEAKKSAPRARPPRKRRSMIATYEPAEPFEISADPLKQLIQLERYGYLLANRDEWRDHPNFDRVCREACSLIDDFYGIVPEGFATLPLTLQDEPGAEDATIDTQPFLLARFVVTNAQFQMFVDDAGYDDLTLWPKDIWPHLIDFVDQTGETGPRYWQSGRHDRRLADHPVVGVNRYEAAAYARWAGFRLPSEAEWQMAATWRIRSEANVMRRYPWGDAFDLSHCNVWATGIGGTVPVDRFPEGASPNQVTQLIGNVWEWTSSEFDVTDGEGGIVVGDMQMASIRGGAFDTYFSSQATGMFRTGLVNLARAHNVGFRLALDLDIETGDPKPAPN